MENIYSFETMTSLHVFTLTVQRELPKYLASRMSICTKNETMAPLHVATLTCSSTYKLLPAMVVPLIIEFDDIHNPKAGNREGFHRVIPLYRVGMKST